MGVEVLVVVVSVYVFFIFFFFQAEDGIRDLIVTGVQTCALPISVGARLGARQQIDLRYTGLHGVEDSLGGAYSKYAFNYPSQSAVAAWQVSLRSEERRVGKECRSRWSPYH